MHRVIKGKSMKDTIEEHLNNHGYYLRNLSPPAGNYIPVQRHHDLLFISGQLPFVDGKLTATGRVGDEVTQQQAYEAARFCALNILMQVKNMIGSLDNVQKIIKLGGFVASAPNFYEQPSVINGASDLMVLAFGEERGKHARFAVGSIALPGNTSVEIEAIIALKS